MSGIANCDMYTAELSAVFVANGIGAYLMLAIMFNKKKRAGVRSLDKQILYRMCWLCLALCLLETASFALDGRTFSLARPLAVWVNVLVFVLGVAMSYLWTCYVDYKIFEDYGRLRRIYRLAAIPGLIVCLMAAANLFTDVFFGISSDNVYYRTPLFFLPYLVSYGYLTYGAILTDLYRRKADRYLFMPVIFFLLPVYLGSLIQFFNYGVALIWVSVALGLTFLYVNLQNEESFLDALTKLYNRNYLLHYMEHMSERFQKGKRLTGIMLDINGFKSINDTYGHMKGDGVLRDMGEVLLRSVGNRAAVAQYGGDEFIILIEDPAENDVQKIRENIAAELEAYNGLHKLPLAISLSAGIAEFDKIGIYEFFREMDRKMYEEKKAYYLQQEFDRL